jgi:hypothetical protein
MCELRQDNAWHRSLYETFVHATTGLKYNCGSVSRLLITNIAIRLFPYSIDFDLHTTCFYNNGIPLR